MTQDDYEWRVSVRVPGIFMLSLMGLVIFAVVQVVK
jgi:hypothetical protein